MLENISIYLSCTFCLVLSLNHKNHSFFAPCACCFFTTYNTLYNIHITSITLDLRNMHFVDFNPEKHQNCIIIQADAICKNIIVERSQFNEIKALSCMCKIVALVVTF